MYAVEFQTHITNGFIEVPESYRAQLSGSVRVIILTNHVRDVESEHPTDDSSTNMITQLLANPRKIADFTPLTRDEIYERT